MSDSDSDPGQHISYDLDVDFSSETLSTMKGSATLTNEMLQSLSQLEVENAQAQQELADVIESDEDSGDESADADFSLHLEEGQSFQYTYPTMKKGKFNTLKLDNKTLRALQGVYGDNTTAAAETQESGDGFSHSPSADVEDIVLDDTLQGDNDATTTTTATAATTTEAKTTEIKQSSEPQKKKKDRGKMLISILMGSNQFLVCDSRSNVRPGGAQVGTVWSLVRIPQSSLGVKGGTVSLQDYKGRYLTAKTVAEGVTIAAPVHLPENGAEEWVLIYGQTQYLYNPLTQTYLSQDKDSTSGCIKLLKKKLFAAPCSVCFPFMAGMLNRKAKGGLRGLTGGLRQRFVMCNGSMLSFWKSLADSQAGKDPTRAYPLPCVSAVTVCKSEPTLLELTCDVKSAGEEMSSRIVTLYAPSKEEAAIWVGIFTSQEHCQLMTRKKKKWSIFAK